MEALRTLEKLTIPGRDRQPVQYPLPWQKVPLYFRRAAINSAIAAASSYLSREKQKERFLERIQVEAKNWKFSQADIRERAYWNDYMDAYEAAVNETATRHSPWYVIPADQKWYTRYLVSEAVLGVLEDIDPHYPKLPPEHAAELQECREALENE